MDTNALHQTVDTDEICKHVSAEELQICWGDNPSYWEMVPDQNSIMSLKKIARLRNVCWFDVKGEIVCALPPGAYTVSWRVHLSADSRGWDSEPVHFTFSKNVTEVVSEIQCYIHGTRSGVPPVVPRLRTEVEHCSLPTIRGVENGWTGYDVGEFVVEGEEDCALKFAMQATDNKFWKSGLSLDGVFVRPKGLMEAVRAQLESHGEVCDATSSNLVIAAKFTEAIMKARQNEVTGSTLASLVQPAARHEMTAVENSSDCGAALPNASAQLPGSVPIADSPSIIITPMAGDLHKILECPLSSLTAPGATINLSLHNPAPCRFRLLDTHAFARSQTLRMFETSSLRTERFAAISYPWTGLSPVSTPPLGAFPVAGAEDCTGGVSIDVLVTTCVAALREKCPLLWFDQMCILQLNEDDKNWQIERMNSLFSGCGVCLALLGGVQRLAGLDEETSWARRAWTLQEALAPPVTRCVFRWTKGAERRLVDNVLWELERGHSGMMELDALLGKVITRRLHYVLREDPSATTLNEEVKIIQKEEANALKCAMYTADKTSRGCALWRCALMRTCTREVDMVFCMMGLFGVTLDPSQFGEKDRKKATLALAQEIMKKGERADWLGMAFGLGPAKFMSTMPEFPETDSDGDVVVKTHNGREKVREVVDMHWFVVDAPTESVDNKGYLHFCGNARPIREVSFLDDTGDFNLRFIKASASKIFDNNRPDYEYRRALWEVLPATEGASATTYAIVIGKLKGFFHPEAGMFRLPDDVIVMIVEKITDGHGLHRIAFAIVNEKMVQDWLQQEFSVGGPGEL